MNPAAADDVNRRRGEVHDESSSSPGMSNCVGGLFELGLPEDAIAQHGVQGCDHLAHDGDDDDLGLLARRGEAITEGLGGGVGGAGAEAANVEDVTPGYAPAVDAAMSPELAAIEV